MIDSTEKISSTKIYAQIDVACSLNVNVSKQFLCNNTCMYLEVISKEDHITGSARKLLEDINFAKDSLSIGFRTLLADDLASVSFSRFKVNNFFNNRKRSRAEYLTCAVLVQKSK
jgi:hypothetical protein